jgi:hypothetical protein
VNDLDLEASPDRTVAARDRTAGVRRFAAPVLAFVAALPALIAAVSGAGSGWYGASDWALEVLRVSDVAHRHSPLVGVASRFGWYHPGPLLFWLLAPGYWLLGQPGVLLVTGLSSAVALAAIVLLADRRGGLALCVWTFLLTAALVHGLGASFLIDPWNPFPPFLWFVVFLFAVWSVAVGDRALVPVAVVAGTFAVQSHVGYLPLVLAVPALTAAGRWGAARLARPPRPEAVDHVEQRPPGWHPIGVAGGLLVVLWVAPVYQQLTERPGNLGEILRYFRHPTDPAAGLTVAAGVMGRQLSPAGPWLTGRDATGLGLAATGHVLPAVLLIVVVAVVGAFAARRGARDAGWLAVVAVIAAVGGLIATSDVRGIIVPYLFRWWWGIAYLLWLSLGWSCWQLLVARDARSVGEGEGEGAGARAGGRAAEPVARWSPVLAGLLVVGGVVLVSVTGAGAVPVKPPFPQFSSAISSLQAQVRPKLRRGDRYLMTIDDTTGLQEAGIGLFVALRQHGYSVFLPSSRTLDPAVGSWRVVAPGIIPDRLTVVTAPLTPALRATLPAGAEVLASYDPLSPQDRATASELSDRVRAQLHQTPSPDPLAVSSSADFQRMLIQRGADPADVARLGALEAAGKPYVVYRVRGR